MTNDEKITTIAKLLREMSDEFGTRIGVSVVRKDECYSADKFAITIGEGYGMAIGMDPDPRKALTEALSDVERKRDEAELRRSIEAEVKARMAMRKAA
jgi:hypothetical protein